MAVFAAGQQLWRASLDSATSIRAEVTARSKHCHACRRPFSHTPNPYAFARLPVHGKKRGRAVRSGGLPCRFSNSIQKVRKGLTRSMHFYALTWRFV